MIMKSKKSSYLLYFIYISAFILINLISMNYFKRIDLTDNKMYSLSDSSKLTIDKIDDPMIIDLYFSDDLPGQLQNNRRYIQDILEEYAAYSNHINFYFIKNDEKFSSKAQTEGLQSQDIQVIENDEVTFKTIFMGMKLRYNGKTEILPMLGVSAGLEYTLTKTIKKLIADKQNTIAIGQAGTTPGIYENINTILSERFIINNNVSLNNLNINNVNLLLLGNIEGDLTEEELASLKSFLDNGGKLFLSQGKIAADPQTSAQGTIKQSNIYKFLNEYGINIEENLILDKNCKRLITVEKRGFFSIQKEIDYPFIPAITEFKSHDNMTTGLDGLQSVYIGFPSEITLTDSSNTSSFISLFETSNNSATMNDVFNLSPLPELNPILNNLNESPKIVGGKLLIPGDGEIILITDSKFLDDTSIANKRITRNDINENYTMIENIIDVMLGDAELVSLRSREIISRPLIDEALGKENSSLRTRWKWINILLPSLLVIGYGLIRRRNINKKSKYILDYYG